MLRTVAGWAIAIVGLLSLWPDQASAQATYCASGTNRLKGFDDQTHAAAVMLTCKAGDVIGIPLRGTNGSFTIERLCDFSKTMITANGFVYCVLIGNMRQTR